MNNISGEICPQIAFSESLPIMATIASAISWLARNT